MRRSLLFLVALLLASSAPCAAQTAEPDAEAVRALLDADPVETQWEVQPTPINVDEVFQLLRESFRVRGGTAKSGTAWVWLLTRPGIRA